MNRRMAIRNALILSAGTSVLPSCLQSDKSLVVYRNLSLTGSDEVMMSQLADTILPKTKNFIGAADVKAREFTLMMLDDCYAPDEQKTFTDGLKQFDKLAAKKYGKAFAKCTQAQRKEWITHVDSKVDVPQDVQRFYEITKKHTLQAFTSSKEYMIDVRQYKIAPGSNFKGCVPLKKS